MATEKEMGRALTGTGEINRGTAEEASVSLVKAVNRVWLDYPTGLGPGRV